MCLRHTYVNSLQIQISASFNNIDLIPKHKASKKEDTIVRVKSKWIKQDFSVLFSKNKEICLQMTEHI